MSMMNPQSGSGRHNSSRPESRAGLWAFIVVAAVLVGSLAYYGYSASRTQNDALSGSSAVAQWFVVDLSKSSFADAYNLLSDSARSTFTPDTLRDEMTSLTKSYGPWVGANLTEAQMQDFGGLHTCKVTYTLEFDHGKQDVTLLLVESDKGWLIDSITLD